MRGYLIILLQLTVSTFAFSQSEEDEPNPHDCVYKARYSLQQRLKFYPFKRSDSIILVSFRAHRNNYPINKKGFTKDSLIEVKSLNKADIDELTDILYNNFQRKWTGIGTLTQCFFPRNAIIFLDKKGNLKEFILICFHCQRQENSSQKIKTGDNCNQKIDKLRVFFIARGLKFGTNRDIESYPGETYGDEGIIYPPK